MCSGHTVKYETVLFHCIGHKEETPAHQVLDKRSRRNRYRCFVSKTTGKGEEQKLGASSGLNYIAVSDFLGYQSGCISPFKIDYEVSAVEDSG